MPNDKIAWNWQLVTKWDLFQNIKKMWFFLLNDKRGAITDKAF